MAGAEGYLSGRKMAKRLMMAIVGAGIGSLAGLAIDFLGAGNVALVAGGVIGAFVPLLVLGPPGRDRSTPSGPSAG